MLITPLTAMLQAEVDRVMRRVGRGFAYFFLPACCRGGLKMIIWTRHVAYIRLHGTVRNLWSVEQPLPDSCCQTPINR